MIGTAIEIAVTALATRAPNLAMDVKVMTIQGVFRLYWMKMPTVANKEYTRIGFEHLTLYWTVPRTTEASSGPWPATPCPATDRPERYTKLAVIHGSENQLLSLLQSVCKASCPVGTSIWTWV